MKIFNYLQEYKREKPVNQQDKLTQTHYPQTEHSPKSQQKRYFISHDKVRIIYFQSSVLVRAIALTNTDATTTNKQFIINQLEPK